MFIPIRQYDQGFSLIEVLISVVIIAIGVLGNVALQTTAIKFSQSAHQRGIAVALVHDMADRIRANIVAINHYADTSCDTTYGADNQHCSQHGSAATTNCTSKAMALYDQWSWTNQVKRDLASSKCTIAKSSETGLYLIIVKWWDNGSHDQQKFTLALTK